MMIMGCNITRFARLLFLFLFCQCIYPVHLQTIKSNSDSFTTKTADCMPTKMIISSCYLISGDGGSGHKKSEKVNKTDESRNGHDQTEK